MKKTTLTLALVLGGLVATQVAQAQAMDGKAVFAKNCAACHMATGAGIPGAFPALKGNKFVQGDTTPLITTVLKGRAGMPTFAASLDDEKLGLVLTYIRSSWGNKAGAIGTADVAAVRNDSKAGDVNHTKDTNVH